MLRNKQIHLFIEEAEMYYINSDNEKNERKKKWKIQKEDNL